MELTSERLKVSTADTGVALLRDVVEEILLRVPARQLRRFRAVCRSWRSLLSDPSFVKAHAALCPALILALAADSSHIDVVDLSGDVVRQIHVPPADQEGSSVLPEHPGPCFLFRANNRVRMVDPDTGAVFTLPFDHHDNPTPSLWSTTRSTDYVLGQDISTGHHKVLRIVNRVLGRSRYVPGQQLCHVLTLGSGDDDNHEMQRWRECPSPQSSLESNVDFPGVTIQGFVYFLAGYFPTTFESLFVPYDALKDKKIKFVVSFDLKKEQWRPTTLQGPSEINTESGVLCQIKLVKLSNTLAVVHSYHSSIDLWFAQDLERGLWVKKHCMQQELLAPTTSLEREVGISLQKKVKILMELDGGRIIFSYIVPSRQEASHWRTRVYDPRSKACMDLSQLDLCGIVGVYVESLLYLVKW